MKLAFIPPGTFLMGENCDEYAADGPAHDVKLTKPFHIGVYEVTQSEYEQVMGSNPSEFKGPRLPVTKVSHAKAVEFCKRLSTQENAEYRLPTEAEWEYACRAGTTTRYYWGDEFNWEYCWCAENSVGAPHEVGTRKPNAWGLYDMLGNVSEWCGDQYTGHPRDPQTDPFVPLANDDGVIRGGAMQSIGARCRSASRNTCFARRGNFTVGFRVVRTISK
jgi:formylglycine-generating enzyme required for sulfatase activity